MSSRVLPARKTSARRKRRQGITKPLRFYRAGTVFSTRGPRCGSAMGRRCLGTRNPGRESRFGRGVGASRLRVGPRARPLAFARWSARPMPHVRPSRTSPHPRTPAPLRASHTPLAPLAPALDPRPGGLILVYQFALESCQTLLSFIGWYASFKTPHFCAYAQIVGDATA